MSQRQPWYSWGTVRQFLVGAPIPTYKAHHERLSPVIGLPVFSSDALSSVAYATEAILSILILLSVAALTYQIYITLAICFLILVVAVSYMQTIKAYPQGGGSYIVTSENLGPGYGLAAGAALMMDYILTVAVSIAAGVAAITSAYPSLHEALVPLCLFFIAVVAWANLRGVRESGALFAIPTYGFVVAMFALLIFATTKSWGTPAAVPAVRAEDGQGNSIIGMEASFPLMFILLRAFAAGCTALTGIEAVSDGVNAFKAPEAKNAVKVLAWMAAILISLFLGVGYVVQHIPELTLHRSTNPEFRTVVSQIAAWTFGDRTFMFYAVQFSTFAILILAANTAFADFPRLASFIARDGYLPRPFARQGDRLVFHNGIIMLSIAAAVLVYVFHGELEQLLPLYAVGVFTAFTLSQAGMVAHWLKHKNEKGWRLSLFLNALGAFLCFIVLLIIAVTKFTEGAWLIIILLPMIVSVFVAIKRRYTNMTSQLSLEQAPPLMPRGNTSLLMVPRVHQGILSALQYARLTDPDCQAVHVAIDERRIGEIQDEWEKYGAGTPLIVLRSPYRSLIGPVLDYVDELLAEKPDQVITVIVPEAASTKWYHRFLQENVAQQLKDALGGREKVVVTNVKYFLR